MTSERLCPNCMAGFLTNGVCARCGKPVSDIQMPPFALPLGYRLANGRYYMGRVLGHGGFGVTYLAWDSRSRARVAIKELFPSGSVTRNQNDCTVHVTKGRESYYQHVRARFKEEAQTIANLRAHPEIIKVYDLFETLGTVYYVMEYLEGEDLSGLLKRHGNAISWQHLEKPIWETIQSLRVLHGHGLIHRDISPDNIFVQQQGETKLIDFGSVRHYKNDHFTTIFKDSFAPTEMFLTNGYQGAWTDTFSLSATLYYMLGKGKLPAKAPDRVASQQLNGADSLVPLDRLSPSAPSYVVGAVMQGLSLNIDQRFKDADAIQRALFPNIAAHSRSTAHGIVCVRGQYRGKKFALPQERVVMLGRGKSGNMIAYPDNPQLSKGISRRHCAFYVDGKGVLYIQDQNSRYGTYLNGKRLAPSVWYQVTGRQAIAVGDEEYHLSL